MKKALVFIGLGQATMLAFTRAFLDVARQEDWEVAPALAARPNSRSMRSSGTISVNWLARALCMAV